jgi:hypothetical protein
MDLPMQIVPDLHYSVKLPHTFLNHLLENGYQFDQGVLCLKLTSVFGSCCCGMTEFKPRELGDSVDIGYEINQYLNIITGEYVHVQRIDAQIPHLIKIQGHRDSFGKITNLKEQMESLLVSIKVLNVDTDLIVYGPDGPEPFTVVELQDTEGHPLNWGTTVEADINVDFALTKETVEREEKQRQEEQEREELERRGYKGPGRKLGGEIVNRQVWLDRLQAQTDAAAKDSVSK